MATPYERFNAAAGSAACQTLGVIGSTLVSVGTVSLVTGVGGGLLLPGMAALLAEKYACGWDPDQPGPEIEPSIDTIPCYETVDGFLVYGYLNGNIARGPLRIKKIISITYTGTTGAPSGAYQEFTFVYIDQDDVQRTSTGWEQGASFDGAFVYTIGTVASGPNQDCLTPAPDTPLLPDLPEVTYTDPDGCVINVTVQGVAVGQAGTPEFVFKMTQGSALRASGGVIGGCNFDPVIFSRNPDGPGEPPFVGPWNPEWDLPGGGQTPWGDFLRDLAGGLLGNLIFNQLSSLLEIPYPGVEYRLNPSCESADPPELPVVLEIPPLKGLDAALTRIDALVPLLQGQKDLKQPICSDRPTLLGDWRTISFRSTTVSPFGKSRLRKRFRYRSLSGTELAPIVDHWIGFSWEAGPVCVIHKGASWGTPQVWASSIDEGKRVIRHAGTEAGIDPDNVGEWVVSGSSSPRIGVGGTMEVDTSGGFYWITARDGSDERPLVSET